MLIHQVIQKDFDVHYIVNIMENVKKFSRKKYWSQYKLYPSCYLFKKQFLIGVQKTVLRRII